MKKPAIPSSDPTQKNIAAIIENIDILLGRRGTKIAKLVSSAGQLEMLAKINEVLTLLQDEEIVAANPSATFSETDYATTANAIGKNRLINPYNAIDQRNAGASQTITAAAALAYTVDRWWAACTGANVTGIRVAGTLQSQYRYQFTGAASVTAIQRGQRIEAKNCYDLNGTTATLSVDLANSLLTTVTWTAYYANTTDTFGTLASPTKTQIATGNFTVTSTLARYSAQISIPSSAITGIEIIYSVGAQTSGTWTIGDSQLEAGAVATVYERRIDEISLCHRYFEKSWDMETAVAAITELNAHSFVSINATDSYDFGRVLMKVYKRSPPTVTVYNPTSGATAQARGYTSASNRNCFTRTIGTSSFEIYSNNWVALDGMRVHYTASSEIP